MGRKGKVCKGCSDIVRIENSARYNRKIRLERRWINISNSFFVKDKDGKPVFIGKEEPDSPRPKGESSKMECPQCHGMFDYLLGEIRMGCEGCYDPSKDQTTEGRESYDESREIKV